MIQDIRCRAPLRLGIAGGGTDLSPFCDRHGGAILNCTIDRYAYAFITPRDDGELHFAARDIGETEEHRAGERLDTERGLRFHRAAYNHFLDHAGLDPRLGLSVTTSVDCPPGSGLGSSSALMVAICEAFRVLCGTPLGLYDLARLAYRLERCELDLAGGKQDQYAAAFGGVNFIEFLPEDRVIVNPLRVAPAILNELEASLVLCWTGVSRKSETIIREQVAGMRGPQAGDRRAPALKALFDLKTSAIDMKQALLSGDLAGVGDILNRSWRSKKETAGGVSSALIDRLFEAGLGAGARAGKVSGAGGGGFVMFLVDPERRLDVIRSLNQAGGQASPTHLTAGGVEVWRRPAA